MKVPEPRRLKSGAWFIQLRLGGVSVPVTADTAKEVRRQAALIKAEHMAGRRAVRRPEDRTLDRILEEYIDERRQALSPSTVRGYEGVRRTRFQSVMHKPFGSVRNWQAVIDAEKVSPKTLANAWRLCVSAVRAAKIPVPEVVLPQLIGAERPWLTWEQIPAFLDAVRGEPCETAALLALHSLRRSEIFGLTWDKVDLNKGDLGQIHVEGSMVRHEGAGFVYKETNKTRKSRRTVPVMIPRLRDLLLKVPEGERHGVIVPSSNHYYEQINRVCGRAGLPQVGIHGLRHSFASLAHHLQLPEEDAMLIGGWEDANTMHKIYTHIAAAERLMSENKMASFYKNANQFATKIENP